MADITVRALGAGPHPGRDESRGGRVDKEHLSQRQRTAAESRLALPEGQRGEGERAFGVLAQDIHGASCRDGVGILLGIPGFYP